MKGIDIGQFIEGFEDYKKGQHQRDLGVIKMWIVVESMGEDKDVCV